VSDGANGRPEGFALDVRTYHGRPVLKAPVWKPEIPWYFFVGGMAGASTPLALAAEVSGKRQLSRRAWLVALAGAGISPVLLISDLGRPERFHHMLRVFKVTSPMSVGSWVLAAFGTTTAVAVGNDLLGLPGWPAKPVAALLGPALSTYTAALLADTSVPVWHEARAELPFLFASTSAASAGAALLLVTPAEESGGPRLLAVAGGAGALALLTVMEKRLGELGEPYHEGDAARYGRASKALTAAGALGLVAFGRRSRAAAAAGAAALLAGAALERWSIFRAGFQSARDPKYVVKPQRERIESGATAGA
jgi:formate-dependent nitrite reductase membrane component NrfD